MFHPLTVYILTILSPHVLIPWPFSIHISTQQQQQQNSYINIFNQSAQSGHRHFSNSYTPLNGIPQQIQKNWKQSMRTKYYVKQLRR